MRSFSHWTPAYLCHRLADRYYRARNPEAPWLTPRAITYLEKALKSDFCGLEYGSGRSTTWFAQRVKSLVSVEHNPDWFNLVKADIVQKGISNIEYHQFAKPDVAQNFQEILESEYVQITGMIAENSLDFALVDGVARSACMLHSIPLLKPGGLLILDDANHYLPCDSQAPNTRSRIDGPLDKEWEQVLQMISNWQAVWFGNGIKETAIFTKPDA
ncbi:MAG: hypothetical protein GYA15_02900 [Leptolinea sp.]|jgi:SAM-dependent methyltransferase|nr:hypothetical protein [Leptolinea sp.]